MYQHAQQPRDLPVRTGSRWSKGNCRMKRRNFLTPTGIAIANTRGLITPYSGDLRPVDIEVYDRVPTGAKCRVYGQV